MQRFELTAPAASRRPMRSGGGVLVIAAAQLLVGLTLLGLYEGYKRYFFNAYLPSLQRQPAGNDTEPWMDARSAFSNPMDWRSPMGFTFYLAIVNNVFAVMGLAGVLNGQRELVITFFAFNATAVVMLFHYFVDMATDAGIKYLGEPPALTSYEKASAAFIFINFALSVAATVFAMRAIDELRTKQREQYNRVLSDTLAFEADHP